METKHSNTLNVQSPKLGRGMSSGFISLDGKLFSDVTVGQKN